jgi:hypothetical protein
MLSASDFCIETHLAHALFALGGIVGTDVRDQQYPLRWGRDEFPHVLSSWAQRPNRTGKPKAID